MPQVYILLFEGYRGRRKDMSEQNTIFYTLKLKRTKTPMEIFEKMKKSVKNKGATKNWICTIDSENESMYIDFCDEKSEPFRLSFDDKKICKGCCKVFFPLSGELFDDEKKSEFKALINMIYSARTSFSEMKITDDYGISESFLDSKVNKIALRELTADETERAERLIKDGHTNVREFIMALMYDYRNLKYSEDFIPYLNPEIGQRPMIFWEGCSRYDELFDAFTDSFLYETTEYQDKGRLYNVRDYYGDLNGVFFAVFAFISGLETITGCHIHEKGWDPKSTQVLRLYYNKCKPLMESERSDHAKCILAYRFFVSSMDYLGFIYVGSDRVKNKFINSALIDGIRRMIDTGDQQLLHDAVCEYINQN